MASFEMIQRVEQEKQRIRNDAGSSPNLDDYKSRLESFSGVSNPNQERKLELAVSYLETHYRAEDGSVQQDKVLQHLDTIDFSKSVELRTIEPDTPIFQYHYAKENTHNGSEFGHRADGVQQAPGEYFTYNGYSPGNLGINQDLRTDRQHKSADARQCREYRSTEPVIALESSHKPGTVDTWSDRRPGREPPQSHSFKNQDGSNREVTVKNDDLQGRHPPTHTSEKARSIYSMKSVHGVNDQGEKTLHHRSGPYVRGGGRQLLIPRQGNPNLNQQAHQKLELVQQKHVVKR